MHQQADAIDSSIPPASTTTPVINRQVVSPSAPVLVPTNPERPKSSLPKEMTSSSDPTWKRLEMIFRKHQEQEEGQSVSTSDVSTPALELNLSDADQSHTEEAIPNETAETTDSEEHSPSIPNSTNSYSSARTVQRSPENAEHNNQSAVTKVARKNQPRASLPTQVEAILKAESNQATSGDVLPEDNMEISDQASATDQPRQQSLPLEAVWNVQRIEAAHPLMDETVTGPVLNSPNRDEHTTSIETSQTREQKLNSEPRSFDEEQNPSTEIDMLEYPPTFGDIQERRETVEVPSPSRPRPPHGRVLSSSASIQRQVEKSQAVQEISERPPVNTAIGPLPADLWWLLGEKPPSGEPVSETNNKIATDFNQQDTPQVQRSYSEPETSVEKSVNATPIPNMIQRQTVSDKPLLSNSPEPVKSEGAEKTKQGEPDLDDLARRVYGEVRRRLATEWERTR